MMQFTGGGNDGIIFYELLFETTGEEVVLRSGWHCAMMTEGF